MSESLPPTTAPGRRRAWHVAAGAASGGSNAARLRLGDWPAMQYHQDEKVLCFHGPLIYQAKV